MGHKIGACREQIRFIALEDMVDPESMARIIDKYVELCDFDKLGFLRATPAATGRPAYPPKALAKLYIYGYESGICSSRKLEKEACNNVEAMWLLEGLRPDYKTISEFRRENLRPLQKLFKEFVKLCKTWDMIGGKLIAIDGTKIKASNNKKNNFSSKKLKERLRRIDEKIGQYLEEAEVLDSQEEQVPDVTKLQELLERKDLYEGYLAQLEARGENEISTIDPDARLMKNNRGGVDMAYNVQSAVDGKYDLILDYHVSLNPTDQGQMGQMVKQIKKKLRLKRFTVLADKGYYNGPDLERVKKYKVEAIVPRQKPSDPKAMPEQFRSKNFRYDENTDTYTCPMQEILSTRNKTTATRRNYFNKAACAACPHQSQCCMKGKALYRTVTRSKYSKTYEEADKRYKANAELYKRRQQIVEHPFGSIKYGLRYCQFLLRTRKKVRVEVALLFLGYNLKRVYNSLGFKELMARLEAIAANFSRFFCCFCYCFLMFAHFAVNSNNSRL